MRNWNIHFRNYRLDAICVFIVPMRNWNCWEYGWESTLLIVFIVPMRNWNMKLLFIAFTHSVVFIVPMRNWNFESFERQVLFEACFYRTYEELKLDEIQSWFSSYDRFLSYLWGIETLLYLSIKKSYIKFLSYLWGIETFLPVGDILTILKFLSYLWGIETRIWSSSFLRGTGVFIVPMRNWNLLNTCFIFCSNNRFYRTYEELKHAYL